MALLLFWFVSPLVAAPPEAPPPFGFPDWIRLKNVTVIADTRSESDAQAHVVCTVSLNVRFDPAAPDGLEVSLTGTWRKSTGLWTFAPSMAGLMSPGGLQGLPIQDLQLSRTASGWTVGGEILLVRLVEAAHGVVDLPAAIGFQISEHGFAAHFSAPIRKQIGTLGQIAVLGATLRWDTSTNAPKLNLVSMLTFRDVTFVGVLGATSGTLQFSTTGPQMGKGWQIPDVGFVQVQDFSLTLGGASALGGSANLRTDGGSVASKILGSNVRGTISGAMDSLTITLEFTGTPPHVPLLGGGSFDLTSVTLAERTVGGAKKFVLGGNCSLHLPSGSLNASFTVDSHGLTVSGLDIPDVITGLSVSLTHSGGYASPWSTSFQGKLNMQVFRSLLSDMGLPTGAAGRDFPVSGSLSGQAIRLEFTEMPSFPVTIPSWLPLDTRSLKKFAVTRELAGDRRTVCDFDLDFDFSGLPGLGSLPKLTMSGLFGKGVAPPAERGGDPSAPSPGGGGGGMSPLTPTGGGGSSSPWFTPTIGSLGGNDGNRFGWLRGGGSGSPRTFGMAFGPPDISRLGSIPLDGPGAMSFSRISGGQAGGSWSFAGGLDLLPKSHAFLGFSMPNSVDLDFSYDGQIFQACTSLSRTLTLLPDMKLSLTDYHLTRARNDASWTFSILSSFDWTGQSPVNGVIAMTDSGISFKTLGDTGIDFSLPSGLRSAGIAGMTFKNLTIGLGDTFHVSADASLPVAPDGVLHFLSGKTSGLSMSLAATEGSFTIATPAGTSFPPIQWSAPGGDKDELIVNSLSLTKPAGQSDLILTGDLSMTFGEKSTLHGALTVDRGSFSTVLTGADLFEGLDTLTVAVDLSKSGGVLTYDATISGDVRKASIETLYHNHGLRTSADTSGTSQVTGKISNKLFSIDIRNIPVPEMPAFPGAGFRNIDDLSLWMDRSTKQEGLSVTADLGITDSIGVRVAAKVLKTTASTSPDVTLDVVPSPGQTAFWVAMPDNLGKLGFSEFGGGRTGGKWSVTGKILYDLPSAWHALSIGSFQIPQEVDLAMTLGESQFSATVAVPSGISELDVLPGFPLKLNTFQLSRTDQKLDFAILSQIPIPSGGNLGGGIGFGASGVQFTCDPKIALDFALPPRIPGMTPAPKLADIRITDFTFTVGSDLALGGAVSITLAKPAKGKNLMVEVLGMDTLAASLQGTPESFSLRTVGLKLSPPPLDLGPLGHATCSFDYVEVGSDGTLDISASVSMLQRTFKLTAGVRQGEPFLAFMIEGGPLELNVKNIFDFQLNGTLQIYTEVGFPAMSVESVHVSIGSAQDPLGVLDAANFVFWLPDPEYYFPGFIFFDKFHGYVDVAGLKANLDVHFPDPFSSSNVSAILNAIFTILCNQQWQPGDFKNVQAPAFGLSNVYIEFPRVPGLVWDTRKKDFVQTPDLFASVFKTDQKNFVLVDNFQLKMSTLLDSISIPSPKDLGLELLKDVSGTHEIKVLGLDASSTINVTDTGFHSKFHLSETIGPVKFAGDFEGDFGKDGSFYLKMDDGLQVKVGSTWHTVGGSKVVLSSKDGFCFTGELLGNTGSGTIRPDGSFSFKAHLNTKGHGKSGLIVDFNANNSKFWLQGKVYIDGGQVFDGYMDIEGGKAKFHVSGSGKSNDIKYSISLDASVGLSKLSIGFHGSADAETILGTYSTGSVNWSLRGHEVSASLKPGGKFHFDLHSGASSWSLD